MNLYHRFRALTLQHRLLFVWGIHVLIVTAAFGLAVILQGPTRTLPELAAGFVTFLPFSLPSIGEDEITEVIDALRSNWLTTGPKVKQFEQEFT